MTQRGRLALLLGGTTYLAAWAFGSRPLYPLATGLVLAFAAAWSWVRLLEQPMRLRRRVAEGDHLEGDDVPVALELELEGARPRPRSIDVDERIERLGERTVELRASGSRTLRARYVLERVPRGRYGFGEARAVLEDPFGLQRIDVPLGTGGPLLVLPRLVELPSLFSDGGAGMQEGRRMLLRRPSGFELHSVREYEQGESLRKVHWRTTARRGRLMVKELEDSPRDEVAVLLDAEAGALAGEPPDSSFDVQVRAAGSILNVHARRRRQALLVVSSTPLASQRVQSSDGDWRRALELLAAAEPTGHVSAAALLGDEASPAARALELVVVTASLPPALVDRLVQRALARRGVVVVFVDPASFGPSERPRREPALLRLRAAGIPLAVVRRGDDLAVVLAAEGGPAGAALG